VDLRKTYFILPNLFTLSSVFCGFFAITLCAGSQSIETLYQAAIAICFAFFFDLADGRVARLTHTQSLLGMQLDSLADVISFGAAPALLVYKWGLYHLGHAGIFIAFLFCGAGSLRLARFNVLSLQPTLRSAQGPRQHSAEKPGKFIVGLPVPAAAAVLVSLVLVNRQIGGSYVNVGAASLALLVVVLSYLMVSRIRFRSFKDLTLSRRTLVGGAAVLAFTAVALLARMHSAFIFVALMGAYLALGLFEEVIFYRRRRQEERGAHIEADGGARSDEEVLAELGAYDEP
jgi:CDP-diacylglycerol--serine O-phosphatidyltransferase